MVMHPSFKFQQQHGLQSAMSEFLSRHYDITVTELFIISKNKENKCTRSDDNSH